jgi:hypothetical protein
VDEYGLVIGGLHHVQFGHGVSLFGGEFDGLGCFGGLGRDDASAMGLEDGRAARTWSKSRSLIMRIILCDMDWPVGASPIDTNTYSLIPWSTAMSEAGIAGDLVVVAGGVFAQSVFPRDGRGSNRRRRHAFGLASVELFEPRR